VSDRSLLLLALTAVLLQGAVRAQAEPSGPNAVFEWFEYAGQDEEPAVTPGHYRNPILAGFYPDPSLCRVGEDYYLVNSSFAYYPGVPIFHSRDLVHWRQIGHVLTRPSQLEMRGLRVSEGIFAPTIRFHDGVFYMITTLVGGGGNFYVTAKDPAGPWSDPVWLPEIDGIDPSLLFDDDGRAYVVNNGPPPEAPLYSGHRALWLQELDLAAGRLFGPRRVIVDGGVDISKQPIWIEGPHLFRKGEWYLLIAAEGGTSEGHSEVVFRSRAVFGPYTPWERNPILTQRDLDPDRPRPVTSTGHADFVETPAGAWWSVFLGCRPYQGRLYNTGRETFLLPVTWTDDEWPTILAPGQPVPLVVPSPDLPVVPAPPMTGSFSWRESFDQPTLGPAWNSLRGPADDWYRVDPEAGGLVLEARPVALTSRDVPSFLGRRQQHATFTATTALRAPHGEGWSAGLVAFQNETFHLYLGVRPVEAGLEVFLERVADHQPEARPETIARAAVAGPPPATVLLRIEGRGRAYTFSFATRPGEWTSLSDGEDGSILSTATAGGFVGTYIGLYARADPSE
jgi:xylan 1,4-beta-xylosidase